MRRQTRKPGLSAKQRPSAETRAAAKSSHSGAINAKWLTKVSTQGLGGGDTKARTWDPTMQPSNQSPLCAGKGNFPAETGARKGRSSLAETKTETRRKPEKPHSGAISASRPIGVRALKTVWWRMQSYANPSPLKFSLFSGKITGYFAIFRP
jgi:hypothetical protein